MRILVACEYSGIVRDAFIRKGHQAISCDIIESESNFGPHYQGDVRDILYNDWDLVIAHPPCTYLSNSGVCHLYKNKHKKDGFDNERMNNMVEGALFFKLFLDLHINKIAIENPIMHGYAKAVIGIEQSQTVQPWMFGHGETKATCLWLKGLPNLIPTNIVDGREPKMHNLGPSKDRGKLRSRTYQGIANAMAEQWG